MAQVDPISTMTSAGREDGNEPISRRRKVYGYLKAANEMRHSYTSARNQRNAEYDDDERSMPGGFPEVDIVRVGDEEMVLFPSYARHHAKKKKTNIAGGLAFASAPGGVLRAENVPGDADYWRKEWEKHEDDNAVVDVDVRGWIYSPHRGPMTRKHRVLVAVARRLSGIPAPPAAGPNNPGQLGRHPTHRESMEDRTSRHEEEAAAREAESIMIRGEGAAEFAWRGSFSERPSRPQNIGSSLSSRSASPMADPIPGQLSHSLTESSLVSDSDDPGHASIKKRMSWPHPANMSKDELSTANANLMARLAPFMHTPLATAPITIFFYNGKSSQSRSINTDDSGHFSVRASLDFIPTSIRVLASEDLSATEKVMVTDKRGVSLVSDIDDTIKHSAISKGVKEIFKNTFIRDLSDLTIQGVKEWYSTLHTMGVQLHYVSNSPWQLYPLLQSYFSLAGLPQGSFHLKQYSGMLQGIFEPAAERKKGSLERIFKDFPERQFLLVGDSGEADLEVYIDMVLANPGRVLGVFIRDVTTTEKKKFFDQSGGHMEQNAPHLRTGSSTPSVRSTKNSVASEGRVSMAPLFRTDTLQSEAFGSPVEKLIDFDNELEPVTSKELSYYADLLELQDHDKKPAKSSPPPRPSKPAALRSPSNEPQSPTSPGLNRSNSNPRSPTDPHKKQVPPPPKPRRPSTSITMPNRESYSQLPRTPFSSANQNQSRTENGERASIVSTASSWRHPSIEDEGYAASARRHLVALWQGSGEPSGYGTPPNERNDPFSTGSLDPSDRDAVNAPQLPSRRGGTVAGIAANLTAYPAAAATLTTNRLSWDQASGPTSGGGGNGNGNGNHNANAAAPGTPPYSKKEEIWRRRWARAEEIMKHHNVVLQTWRVGTDVMETALHLVDKVQQQIQAEERQKRRGGIDEGDEHLRRRGGLDVGREKHLAKTGTEEVHRQRRGGVDRGDEHAFEPGHRHEHEHDELEAGGDRKNGSSNTSDNGERGNSQPQPQQQ